MSARKVTGGPGVYQNEAMVCEFVGCHNGVARAYHPYCARCYRQGILKGRFESRNGKFYSYDGHSWVVCDNAT